MIETKPSKLFYYQNGYLSKEPHKLMVCKRVCVSCQVTWWSQQEEILERFVFEVPGGWAGFVCPECRHMGDNG